MQHHKDCFAQEEDDPVSANQIHGRGVKNKVFSKLLGSLTNVNQGQEVAATSKNRKEPKPSNNLICPIEKQNETSVGCCTINCSS